MSKGLTLAEVYGVGKQKRKYVSRVPKVLLAVKEAHYWDANGPTTFDNAGGAGGIIHVNAIPMNDTVTGRTGKRVRMKSIALRGIATAGSAGTICSASLLIVLDRKPSGALPAVTDILVAANAVEMLNDVGSTRFKILKRINMQLIGNSTTVATGMERHFYDEYVMLPYDAVYDVVGTTGAIAQMRENALYVVGVGTVAAGTTAGVNVVRCRVRFYDV